MRHKTSLAVAAALAAGLGLSPVVAGRRIVLADPELREDILLQRPRALSNSDILNLKRADAKRHRRVQRNLRMAEAGRQA